MIAQGLGSVMCSPAHILPAAAARYGTKMALITATRTMTFRALDEESDRVASALRERGVQEGQTVSLCADTTRYASRRLAAYKRPRHNRFVDDLPKTSSGKIMRRALIGMRDSSSEREGHE